MMKRIKIYGFLFAALAGIVCFSFQGKTQETSALEIVRKNIMKQYLEGVNRNRLDKETTKWMQELSGDGSWPDINYDSRERGVWEPGQHFERIRRMAAAYMLKDGAHYGDPKLYELIGQAVIYWISRPKPPKSDNWYFASITLPLDAGYILLCMQEAPRQLSGQAVSGLLDWMKKSEPIEVSASSAFTRTLAVGMHNIIRGCVTGDEALVKNAVEHVVRMLRPGSGFTGIQADYSFHAHGAQLDIHAYGETLLHRLMEFIPMLAGSPYALTNEQMQEVYRFARLSFIKVARGGYTDFNVVGRQVARRGDGNARRFIRLLRTVRDMDAPQYADEYNAAIARFSGERPADYKIKPEHLQFWSSDYQAHIRPEYFSGLRMVSTRTVKAEKGNGENLLEHFRTDGVMTVMVRGDEYYGIFPLWKWNQIPGTTVPALDDLSGHKEWFANPGKVDFAGGASDGVYGVAAYAMDDYDTQAKKAWFFFDRQIVCLGAGISGGNAYPVYTTINQSLSNGGVTIRTAKGDHTYDRDSAWKNLKVTAIKNDEVGYSFSQETTVQLSNAIQTGSWRRINVDEPEDPVSKRVFRLHIDHGLRPQNASYAYSVWPAISDIRDIRPDEVRILKNTKEMQAVYSKEKDICQAVFYTAGSLRFGKQLLETDKPCIVMIRDMNGKSPLVYVADPTQKLTQINIRLDRGDGRAAARLVELPSGKMAGKTVLATALKQ